MLQVRDSGVSQLWLVKIRVLWDYIQFVYVSMTNKNHMFHRLSRTFRTFWTRLRYVLFFFKKRFLPKICSACCLTFESPAVSLRTARFNIKKFNMVLALLWVFCTDHRTESDFCFVHHWLTGFYSRGGKCLLRGTDWFLIYSRLRFVFERFSSSAYSYLNNILVLLVRAALNCHYIFFWNVLSFDDKICTGIPPPVPSRIQ